MVNFIGVGAQRCATSWLYSCLYEHPEICAPQKEIHFFSRSRYEEKGIGWYKELFSRRCREDLVKGEFSTSYLFHSDSAQRIHSHFPNTKIVIALREPLERAYSQYRLHGKVGWIDIEQITFEEFLTSEPTAIEQSLYYNQIKRYTEIFPAEQLHFIFKDDIDKSPGEVLKNLFLFLGVDSSFKPSLLSRRINSGRQPKLIWINRLMQHISHFLYSHGLSKIVFLLKKSGLPAWLRAHNTKVESDKSGVLNKEKRQELFTADVEKTGVLIGQDLLKRWNY